MAVTTWEKSICFWTVSVKAAVRNSNQMDNIPHTSFIGYHYKFARYIPWLSLRGKGRSVSSAAAKAAIHNLNQIDNVQHTISKMLLYIHIGLENPSSDVQQSFTSITILTGMDLPNVFFFLCSAIPMSPSVIKFRDNRVKSMHKRPVVLSRSVTLIAWMLFVCTVIVALYMSLS